jgi:predicted helicase
MRKVERLLETETEKEARQLFRLCSQDQWQYADAKKELAHNNWHQDLAEILYRPFDKRWTVFNRYVAVHRRERVMRHMLAGENIGLTIGRAGQVIHQDQWDIVFCTRNITEFNLFRRGGNNLFPLYLYSLSGARTANLAPAFISELASSLAMIGLPGGRGDLTQTFGPEDVFTYIYAVLHSPTYRRRYAQFLKRDFPRVPLTSNANLFRTLCGLGSRLISLHLSEQDATPVTTFPINGNNSVETVRYDYDRSKVSNTPGRIWINNTQYFAYVPSETWAYSVGGYQVCSKWLKDRRGRKLSDDELTHYLHVVAALTETTAVMREIDEVIENQGGYFTSRRFDHSADSNV